MAANPGRSATCGGHCGGFRMRVARHPHSGRQPRRRRTARGPRPFRRTHGLQGHRTPQRPRTQLRHRKRRRPDQRLHQRGPDGLRGPRRSRAAAGARRRARRHGLARDLPRAGNPARARGHRRGDHDVSRDTPRITSAISFPGRCGTATRSGTRSPAHSNPSPESIVPRCWNSAGAITSGATW